MAVIADASVVVTVDDKKLKKDFDVAHKKTKTAAGKMQRTLDRINFRKMSAGIGSVITKMKGINVGLASIAVMAGGVKIASLFIDAANAAEQYMIRLKILLGSQLEANILFQDLKKFASRVPFEFRDIMEAGTALAGVMQGGKEEIMEWMPMIGDLAAVTGMALKETIGQVIRMYSAGAASADMFRERGILTMLGFQAGVTYSAEQTRDILINSWNAVDSKFRGATAGLRDSWRGLMSMMADAWDEFRRTVMDENIYDRLKGSVRSILDDFRDWKTSGGMKEFAESISVIASSMLQIVKLGGKSGTLAQTLQGIGFMKAGRMTFGEFTAGPEKFKDRLNELRQEDEAARVIFRNAERFNDMTDKLRRERRRLQDEFYGTTGTFAPGDIRGVRFKKNFSEFYDPFNVPERRPSAPVSPGVPFIPVEFEAAPSLLDQMSVQEQSDMWDSMKIPVHDYSEAVAMAQDDIRRDMMETQRLANELSFAFYNVFTDRFSRLADVAGFFMDVIKRKVADAFALKIAGSGFVQGIERFLGLDVPEFGDGGIVRKPTLAVVGEKGPEAIIPLNKGGGMGEMGGDTYITINAIDAKSFIDRMESDGEDVITGLVGRNINDGGFLRDVIRNSL